MADRLIRDELLTSERYWAVSDEAKLLYIHLLLCADDTARYTGKNFSLRTKCFPGRGMEASRLENILIELSDQDMIRLYMVGNDRFVFIPRFRQRLRYTKSKYPAPPNEINDLPIEKSDLSQTQARPKSAEEKKSEEKRSEEKGRTTNTSSNPADLPVAKKPSEKKFDPALMALPDCIDLHVWKAWCNDRAQRRKPITERAAVLQITKLKEWHRQGIDPAMAINKAIESGWSGLFKPDDFVVRNNGQRVNRQEALEQNNRAIADQLIADMQFGSGGAQ